MKKRSYLGPTIIGVATTSTVFDGTALPATITEAAQEEPALLSLCVPIANASKAMQEITNGKALPPFSTARLWLMQPSWTKSRATNLSKGVNPYGISAWHYRSRTGHEPDRPH